MSVAEVGLDALLVHDEARDDPGLAFALSRLARGPYEPTPIGVFRAVERPEYGAQMSEQITDAQGKRGLGDVAALLRSGSSWTVELATHSRAEAAGPASAAPGASTSSRMASSVVRMPLRLTLPRDQPQQRPVEPEAEGGAQA